MSKRTKFEIQLIQKMAEAIKELKGLKKTHTYGCVVDLDPESMQPCTCGAIQHNAKIDRIITSFNITGG